MLSENIPFPVCSQGNIGWHFSDPDCCFAHSSKRLQQRRVSNIFSQVFQGWKISGTGKSELRSSCILEVREQISVLHQAAQNPKKELLRLPRVCHGDNPGSCSQQLPEFPASILCFRNNSFRCFIKAANTGFLFLEKPQFLLLISVQDFFFLFFNYRTTVLFPSQELVHNYSKRTARSCAPTCAWVYILLTT